MLGVAPGGRGDEKQTAAQGRGTSTMISPPPGSPPPPAQKMAPFTNGDRQVAPPQPTDRDIQADPFGPRFASLRSLRQQVQDIQASLNHVRAGDAHLQDFADSIARGRDRIQALIDKLVAEVEAHDTDMVESMGHIEAVWFRMTGNPPLCKPHEETSVKDLLRFFNLLDEDCHEIIYAIGYWTIPQRLEEWLLAGRPGYYVPFHAVFEDELPLESDRIKVLNHLSWSPKTVNLGRVDSEHGLVYRYSRRIFNRVMCLLAVIATPVLIAFLIAYLANPQRGIPLVLGHLLAFALPDWPLSKGGDHSAVLVAGWFAVLAGVGAHALGENAKRLHSADSLHSVVAPSNLLRWISAFWGRTSMRIFQALIAFFSIALTQDLTKAPYLEFFLAGYALDSVIGLVGTSLDKRSGAAVTSLKRQLGVTA